MRLIGALKTDIRFQYKQGFYWVYVLLTVIYLVLIQKLPAGIVREYSIPLVIFTDPSLIGFFFIGGIVMLEKQQGITEYLAVTPLSPKEYFISKAVSLGTVAIAASFMIAIPLCRGSLNWGLLFIGISLTSVFFTFYGFIVAAGCRTVNQYFIKMVPFLLLAVLPCFSLIGFNYSWLFNALPSVSGLMLILGAFQGITLFEAALYILIMCLWILIIFRTALLVYDKKILFGGGDK
jgi:fluoroquinolone transport system permease protein